MNLVKFDTGDRKVEATSSLATERYPEASEREQLPTSIVDCL